MHNIRWHFFWWFNYFVLTLLLRRKIDYNERRYELEKWGSSYGGWYIPTKLIKKNWIYYLVGVGDDISFDLSLVKRIGCNVYLFDPTPKSIKYMQKFKKNKRVHFFPIGIWNKDEAKYFYKPQNPNWVSYSITDLLASGQKAFKANCKRLVTVKKKLQHQRIDLLKLDIDGAEYLVLNDMLTSGIRPKVLLVDFDQPVSVIKTYQMILSILKAGYDLAIRDMWNYTFIRNVQGHSS